MLRVDEVCVMVVEWMRFVLLELSGCDGWLVVYFWVDVLRFVSILSMSLYFLVRSVVRILLRLMLVWICSVVWLVCSVSVFLS